MIFKEEKDLLIECQDTCGIFRIDNCDLVDMDYPYAFRFYSDSPEINTKLVSEFNNQVWEINKEVLCYFQNQFFINDFTKDRTACFIKPFKKKYSYMFRVEPLLNDEKNKNPLFAFQCWKTKLPKHSDWLSREEELVLKKKQVFGVCISKQDINKIQKYLDEQINVGE